jgi:uncharacterized protein YecT (DUF1311 family)
MKILTSLLLLAISSTAHGAHDARETIPEACKPVKKLAVPEDQMPSMKDRDKLQKCSSEALYYGIGTPADPLMARHCAVLEDETRNELVFSGSAILMMVYANGNGAAQDYELALHFACEVDGAPAEVEGRVAHLVKLKTDAVKKPNFDFCDDITSGFMMGHCASHQARMAKPKTEKAAAELRSQLSPAEQRAYDSLRTAANNYFFSRSREEVDLSGSARAMFITEEEENLKKSLTESLAILSGSKVPEATEKEADAADKGLNAAYAKLKGTTEIGGGTVSYDGIKKTQKLWLKYRDAWVAFAKVKQPTLSKFAVLKWQTEKREKMLAEFVGMLAPQKKIAQPNPRYFQNDSF